MATDPHCNHGNNDYEDIHLDAIQEVSMEADITDIELPVIRQNMLNHYLGQQMAPRSCDQHGDAVQYVNVPQDDLDIDLGDTHSDNGLEHMAPLAGEDGTNHYEVPTCGVEAQPRRQSLVQTINMERERYQSLERNVNQHQAKYQSLEKDIGLQKAGNNNQSFPNVYNPHLMQYSSSQDGMQYSSTQNGTLPKASSQGRIVQAPGAARPAGSNMALNGSSTSVNVLKPDGRCLTKYVVLATITLCLGNLLFGAFSLWLAVVASKKKSAKRRQRLNRLSLIISICGIITSLILIAALVSATVMTSKYQSAAPLVDDGFDDYTMTDGSGFELGSGSGNYELGQSGADGHADDEDFKIPGSGSFRHNAQHAGSYISHNGHTHDIHSNDFVFDDAKQG